MRTRQKAAWSNCVRVPTIQITRHMRRRQLTNHWKQQILVSVNVCIKKKIGQFQLKLSVNVDD